MNPILEIKNVSKYFFDPKKNITEAIDKLAFDIEENSFVTLVGPSGCGKSTILRCICGLMEPTDGEVLFKNRKITAPRKEITLIFQEYSDSLLPWKSVLMNVTFVMKGKTDKNTKIEKAKEILEKVGLEGFEDHYTWQLSGGMQQRLAIARALAYEAPILLMDEPFASVDAQTRTSLENEMLSIWKKFNKTILFVTHDIDEAIYLSERVLVLSKRPSRVLKDINIELDYPRHHIRTRENKVFLEYKRLIYDLLQ